MTADETQTRARNELRTGKALKLLHSLSGRKVFTTRQLKSTVR